MIENLADSGSSPASPQTPVFKGPVADIVAVHGLKDDGRATWTDPATGILWLRDLFPHQSLNVRILSFNYHGHLRTATDADRVLTLATNLVGELCADRVMQRATQRPIIFVCHGFGGLIVKRALAFSETKRAPKIQHLRDVFVSTYGIIFFGTPHSGIDKTTATLTHDHRRASRRGLTHLELSLIKGSELLQDIEDQFASMTTRLAIYNLWEGEPTLLGKQARYLVDKISAVPEWPNADSNELPATHDNMTKFTKKSSPGYLLVYSALSRYIKAAGMEIPVRWREDTRLLKSERHHEAEELLGTHLPYLLPSTSRSDSKNEWYVIPRHSSKYFVGRSQHADTLKYKLGPIVREAKSSEHHIFVISGIGGSGKSQFCLHYAEQNRPSYWGVFWIDMSSPETAEAGFASLGQQAKRGASCGAGMLWLSQSQKPWLLILDNADDPDMDITSYIPGGGGGHVVITTRNPGFIEHSTVGYFRFSGMDPKEGLNLLLQTAFADTELERVDDKDHEAAQCIASELGYLALALTNAGAAIRLKIYTLQRYLHYYLGLRMRTISSPSIGSVADANIVTTWEIPFQRIADHAGQPYHDAVDLIHILAFMHFESIPGSVFYRLRQDDSDSNFLDNFIKRWASNLSQDEDPQTRLQACLSILYSHSLVDYDSQRGVISLHPMVQRWAKTRLTKSDQQRWLDTAISILAHSISPDMEASGRTFRRSLIPHIEACLKNLRLLHGTIRIDSLKRAMEIENFALVFSENGLWKRARALQLDVISLRKKTLGKSHPHTIRVQRSFADSNWNLFDLKNVLEVQSGLRWTLLLTRPSVRDWLIWPPWYPEHVSYCLNLSDLTQSLWLAGSRDLAKWTGQRAVCGLDKRLGSDDPLTLTAKFNLSRTLMHLGNYKESHQLLLEVLHKRRLLFGPTHPDTLMARNELGVNMYFSKRNLAASERILENTLAARKHVLGAEHAYTLWTMNDLAKVYSTRCRHEKAIKLLKDTLPVAKRTLGESHVGVFMTESNLARAFVRAGRWDEAEFLIHILRRKTPKDHPEYLLLVSGFIYVLVSTGRLKEAESECLCALDTGSKGKRNLRDLRQTLPIARHLALIYKKQGRDRDMEAVQRKFPGVGTVHELQFSI